MMAHVSVLPHLVDYIVYMATLPDTLSTENLPESPEPVYVLGFAGPLGDQLEHAVDHRMAEPETKTKSKIINIYIKRDYLNRSTDDTSTDDISTVDISTPDILTDDISTC
jgi:hypothetical protein